MRQASAARRTVLRVDRRRGHAALAAARPVPAITDLWYKNAVICCLSVGTLMDSNGDGVGDFAGLMRRLDYLHGLGVTAIWVMPFQTSPGQDDGYDVSDYHGVNPASGTLAISSSSPTAPSSGGSASSSTSWSTTRRISIRGFRRPAVIDRRGTATATSGPTRNRPTLQPLPAVDRTATAAAVPAPRPLPAGRGERDLLLYVREHQQERPLIALNLGADAMAVMLPDRQLRGRILVSSGGDRDGMVVAGDLTLGGHEGVILTLEPDAEE